MAIPYFENMPDPLRPNSVAALCAALLMIRFNLLLITGEFGSGRLVF